MDSERHVFLSPGGGVSGPVMVEVVFEDFTVTVVVVIVSVVVTVRVVIVGADSKVVVSARYGSRTDNSPHIECTELWFELEAEAFEQL